MSEDNKCGSNHRFSHPIGFGVFLRPDGTVRWPEEWDLKRKQSYLRMRREVHNMIAPGEPHRMVAALERSVRAEEESVKSAGHKEFTESPA